MRRIRVRVCGRTDAGVHAVGQVFRFRATRHDCGRAGIDGADCLSRLLNDALSATGVGVVRCTRAEEVTRAFHPVFGARRRAYAYAIDAAPALGTRAAGASLLLDEPARLDFLDAALRELEGRRLDYVGLSYGRLKTRDAYCILHHARARRCICHCDGLELGGGGSHGEERKTKRDVVCIELVGNRFLRRMVRLLVDAAMRLALSDPLPEGSDALLRRIEEMDRGLIVAPAPPDGLIFVGAEFEEC